MDRKMILLGVIIVFILSMCILSIYSHPEGYIDVHTHLLPYGVPPMMQGEEQSGGEGGHKGMPGRKQRGPRQAGWDGAAQTLIGKLDRYGVKSAIVMPAPAISGQRRPANSEETRQQLLALAKRYPGRIYAGLGGEVLNTMIHDTDPASVTQEIRTEFEREAERFADSGIRCFGEMAVTHISLNRTHPFEQSPADHPLFLLLADIAAKRDIPIDIHMDCVVKDNMPTPPKLREMSPNNPETLKENLSGLERLLSHNRSAKIVWQHIGRDVFGAQTPDQLRRLLNDHSNLYLAVLVMPITNNRPVREVRLIDEKGQIRPEWVALFREFPDRFVVGTDEFNPPPGHSIRKDSFESTWQILDEQLPQDLRAKICGENAARVYKLDK